MGLEFTKWVFRIMEERMPMVKINWKDGFRALWVILKYNLFKLIVLIMRKKNIILIAVILFFAVIFSLISIVNHLNYRTFALDLGMFNHALYSFSHFQLNTFTLSIDGSEVNYFGDHFSPIIILLSPFSFIFKSYTLLFFQIAFILYGGLGIFKYSLNKKLERFSLSIILVIHFFSIWGIYSALAFDFHANVMAAMLFPWLLLFYERNETKKFLFVFILMILCKENISLWLAFIMISLFLFNKQKNFIQKLKFEFPLIIISLLYFIFISFYIMKMINAGHGTIQTDKYIYLGRNLSEIFNNIFKEPKYVFSLLFELPDSNPIYFGIKSEFYYMFLVSGGIFVVMNPKYLIMILPLLAQKMFSNAEGMWGIKSHYSIEFAPILSFALIEFLEKYKFNIKLSISLLMAIITILATISTIDNSKVLFYKKDNIAFYNKLHYQTNINIDSVSYYLDKIPEYDILSVSSNLAPRLAFRKKIYHFPNIKDSKYILINKKNLYPFHSLEELQDYVNNIIHTNDFYILNETTDLIILKRKNYKNTFLNKI